MARELESGTRERLERELLPSYLPQQRWFGGKGQRIADVRIIDVGRLEVGLRLLLAEVNYLHAKTPGETYVLALKWGETSEPEVDPLSPGIRSALLNLIASRGSVKLEHGRLQAFTTSVFQPVPDTCAVKRLDGEQSNTSFLIGDQYILKLIRRLEPGPNPELETGRFLLERTTFRRVPAPAGWVEYERPGQDPATLAMLHQFVSSEGSAWDAALRSLQSLFAEPGSQTVPVQNAEAGALGFTLGRRTGELHLALASADDVPAFRPEPLTADDLRQIQGRICEHIATVLPALEKLAAGKASTLSDLTATLLAKRSQLVDAARPPALQHGAMRIRCHGDYHLGQVLWEGHDCWIIDFEGEPTRPLAERRAKHSPLKDVAGMLRSFDYAARAGLGQHPAATEEIKRLARNWVEAASSTFLRAYRDVLAGASFSPPDPDFTALLNFFLLDKALYELHYELNNRPDWVGIPLAGILGLLK
jgi:trehalose synthase-fused probable maltokinase